MWCLQESLLILITTREGLSNDAALTILEDWAGRQWVGTAGGLNLIENGRIVHPGTNQGLRHPVATGRAEADTGKTVQGILCQSGGLLKVNRVP